MIPAGLAAADLVETAAQVGRGLARTSRGLLLNPGSGVSLMALSGALCVAAAFTLAGRRRRVKARVLLRAFFPRRIFRSASTRADVGFFVLNTFAVGSIAAWTILSASVLGRAVYHGLVALTGGQPDLHLGTLASRMLVTVTLFLAYELAYWTNHYASHRVPLLWEFHKVHHTAEVLTPVTNFRVHPVDSIVFGNFLAVFVGVAAGLAAYFLGEQSGPFMLGRANAILVVFLVSVIPLQHSHFWIAATGRLGRILMSPAHHQIHHSDDAAHHDRNFGSCLALWDWLFGTLVIPQAKRQSLTFGAGPRLAANHTATGAMLAPFARAWRRITVGHDPAEDGAQPKVGAVG